MFFNTFTPGLAYLEHVGSGNVINTGTINTEDATWTQISSSTSRDYDGLMLTKVSFYPSGECKNALVDVAVGASSSEVEIASDFLVRTDDVRAARYPISYMIPTPVPAGTRISARCRQSESANTYIRIYGYKHTGPKSERFTGVVKTVGANLADSGGTQIEPDASTAWTYGLWENLTTNCPIDARIMQLGIGRAETIANTTTRIWDLQIGIGSTPDQTYMMRLSCGYIVNTPIPQSSQPFPVNIPAGSTIKARAQCSSTSRRELDVIAYLWG